jgi:hypothetical protein
MAKYNQTLTAVNDLLGPVLVPTDKLAIAGVQVGGVGSYKLQGSLDKSTFFDIELHDPSGGANFTTLTTGTGYADVSYCTALQVIKTAGVAAEVVTLVVNHSH